MTWQPADSFHQNDVTMPPSLLPVLYIVLVILMLVGLAGSFLPALPGIGLIVAAILIWTLASPTASSVALIVAVIALVLSLGIGYLATYLGAKRVGASRWGQIGSVVGLVVGFLGLLPALPVGGPLLGILVGTMLGAFIGEFLFRKDLALFERFTFCTKVSLAVVVSSLIGTVLEGLLALTAIVVFLVTTWQQSGLGLPGA
ncbi:MAG: DUF456 family protein [Cyanobacteria bacterium J06554_3]